jgi:DNA polymerase-3 subunit epsilon
VPIELAALLLPAQAGESPQVLINELIALSDGSLLTPFDTKQTGITLAMLRDARPAQAVLLDLASVLPEGCWLMAHNATFERAVLRSLEVPTTLSQRPMLDTLRLARRVLPDSTNHGLDELAWRLNLELPRERHRALADTLLTCRVFEQLLAVAQETIQTTRELFEIMHLATKDAVAQDARQISLF